MNLSELPPHPTSNGASQVCAYVVLVGIVTELYRNVIITCIETLVIEQLFKHAYCKVSTSKPSAWHDIVD